MLESVFVFAFGLCGDRGICYLWSESCTFLSNFSLFANLEAAIYIPAK